jgi:hypothetical protein
LEYLLRAMRSLCALVTLVATVMAPTVLAADSDAIVAVNVRVSSRMSLHVSTNVLEFVVPDGQATATALVDFTASVRLPSSSAVVLEVEPAQPAVSAHKAVPDPEITFAGAGEGMKSGTLPPSASAVAAAWEGSGQRHGRIIFMIHAPGPGVYRVPVHLVLATP